MTADERLNQLEPLVSEGLAVLDRHTAQFRQLQNSAGQLITTATQHSDTLNFLLREQLAMKGYIAELKAHQVSMDGKLDQILNLLQKPGA
ncbi:hypothetical protein Q5H93_11905 [Hymenobacter sp. ASUV-10]|uniref:Uncharacterized protein n=1 Tax=Hymenobacter aranciens TaxID=3063996 RepID=A0ABT9BAZ5_9BACT|nr:hypothetical protein [Hymenobacter sp. ASUV-10]MDO7875437.1 hypothetical protein [Hymenobacter sp. ASUV-10]